MEPVSLMHVAFTDVTDRAGGHLPHDDELQCRPRVPQPVSMEPHRLERLGEHLRAEDDQPGAVDTVALQCLDSSLQELLDAEPRAGGRRKHLRALCDRLGALASRLFPEEGNAAGSSYSSSSSSSSRSSMARCVGYEEERQCELLEAIMGKITRLMTLLQRVEDRRGRADAGNAALLERIDDHLQRQEELMRELSRRAPQPFGPRSDGAYNTTSPSEIDEPDEFVAPRVQETDDLTYHSPSPARHRHIVTPPVPTTVPRVVPPAPQYSPVLTKWDERVEASFPADPPSHNVSVLSV